MDGSMDRLHYDVNIRLPPDVGSLPIFSPYIPLVWRPPGSDLLAPGVDGRNLRSFFLAIHCGYYSLVPV